MSLNNLIKIFINFEHNLEDIKKQVVETKSNNISFGRTNIFYNGVIISIYGIFEKFIDEIGEEYLEFVFNHDEKGLNKEMIFSDGKLSDYFVRSEKPSKKEKLIELYKENLGDFLLSPKRHTNIDGSDENVSRLLISYVDAKSKGDYSQINKQLLLFHGGNMKSDVLFSFFEKQLKIVDLHTKIVDKKVFKRFIVEELGIEERDIKQTKSQTNSDIYLLLNRLVDERNVVSHQGISDNKISLDELANRTIPFLICFCDAITRYVCETIASLYEFEHDSPFINTSLINVYDNSIICHNNESYDIWVNDYFLFLADNEFIVARIISIGKDRVSIQHTGKDEFPFGFKVDETIKNNHVLVALLK